MRCPAHHFPCPPVTGKQPHLTQKSAHIRGSVTHAKLPLDKIRNQGDRSSVLSVTMLLRLLPSDQSIQPPKLLSVNPAGRPRCLARHELESSASIFARLETVCRLTSSTRATSACGTPRLSIRIPLRRRASSPFVLSSDMLEFRALIRSNQSIRLSLI
ncbi:protein of unknown function [Paraburkholderia kururiensis]